MSRDLIWVSFSLMVWGLGEGMFYIFQPLYLQQFGADPRMIGGILGALGVAMAAAQVPAGFLADRIGSRPLMWAAWVVSVLASGIMAFAANLSLFVIGMMLYGLTAFVSAPMNSYIAAIRGRWGVGRAITTTQAGYNLGAIAGPAIGGWIGNQFGLRQVYFVSFVLFILSALIIFLIRAEPKSEHAPSGKTVRLHRNMQFLALLPFFFLTPLATYLPQSLASNYLQNQQGLDYGLIGQLGSIGSLGVVVFMLALGSIPPLVGLLLGQVAIGLFTLLLWQGTGFGWFALGYFFIGGYRLLRSMFFAFSRPLVPPGQVGFGFGLIELANGTAFFLAANLGGWIYSIQPASLFTFSLVLGGAAIGLNLIFLPGLQRSKTSPLAAKAEMEETEP